MASVVQNMIDTVLGDGARSSKFECEISFGANLFDNEKDITVLAKTSQFPGKTHEVIPMVYKGRTIPIKGQTKYENTWSCTFYLTEDHALKKAFEDWIEAIDQVHNIKEIEDEKVKNAQQYFGSNGYTNTLTIEQKDFHGEDSKVSYTLYNAFPISVSAVDTDASEVGSILEFTVEFSYAYYNTRNIVSGAGNFVDEMVGKANKAITQGVSDAKNGLTSLIKSGREESLEIINNLTERGSSKESSMSQTAKDMGDKLT